MIETEYRRYTTAELRNMPDTARLESKLCSEWIPGTGVSKGVWYGLCWDSDGLGAHTETRRHKELARLLLRRIA